MPVLGLDDDSSFRRWEASNPRPPLRSLGQSIVLGTIAFTVLSLGVFATWAFGGRLLYGNLGELGAYAVWCVMFLAGAGLLRPVLIGPVPWIAFYGAFLPGFFLYALIWTVAWKLASNTLGETLGAVLGMAGMGGVFCFLFRSLSVFPQVAGSLIVGNVVGYFIGSWFHANTGAPWAQLLWGASYGLGTGAGFGAAFYFCQTPLRQRIQAAATREAASAEGGGAQSGETL